MNRSLSSALVITALSTALAGCSDLERALGLVKAPPDEFAVVSASPLSLPPDYGLRPPHSISGKPATPSPTADARNTVFRLRDTPTEIAGATGTLSPGQQALLAKADALNVDPRIREALDSEVNKEADASDSFVDSLLFWRDNQTPQGDAIDPETEAKRLKAEGVTAKPSAERTDRSISQATP